MKGEGGEIMSRVVVICVGNPHRGDDMAGSIVARRLREAGLEEATVLEKNGEALDLIETWKGAGLVILIDAVKGGGKPGTVHTFDIRDESLSAAPSHRVRGSTYAHGVTAPSHRAHGSTHSLGVAEAIELARELNVMPEELFVYGIEGRSFETGAAVSPEVREAAIEVADSVIKKVKSSSSPARQQEAQNTCTNPT